MQDTGHASTQMMQPDVSHELYTGTCISEMAITTITGTQVIRDTCSVAAVISETRIAYRSCVHLGWFSCYTVTHIFVACGCVDF